MERTAVVGRLNAEGGLELSRWSQASPGDTIDITVGDLLGVVLEGLVPGQLFQTMGDLSIANVTPIQVDVGSNPYAVGSSPRGDGGQLKMSVVGGIHWGTEDPDADVGILGDMFIKVDADQKPIALIGPRTVTDWNDANGNLKVLAVGSGASDEFYTDPAGNTVAGEGDRSGLTGGTNTLVGRNTGLSLTAGTRNTLIGGDTAPAATGNDNTVIGKSAGNTLTTGNNCTFVGKGAGSGYTDEDNVLELRTGNQPRITFDGVNYFLDSLPAVDPNVTGALWNDAGTLKVSA